MKKQKEEKGKRNKTLFWLPRIITIIFILFLSMFSLDVFGMGLGFWQTILALFIHLIPSIILALISIFFWRKSLILGIMWIASGIFYIALMIPNMLKEFQFYYLAWIIQLSGLAFVIAILFLIDHKKN